MAELALLNENLLAILSFVRETINKSSRPTDNFNWLGLADTAASNALLEGNTREIALVWAKIATLVYSYLESGLSMADRASYERSMWLLRIKCIQKFGINKEDELLNPQMVIDWFVANTNIDIEEAKEKAKCSDLLPSEQWLELCLLKNRLRLVRLLFNNGQVPKESSAFVNQWLAIEPVLP